jgi:uncharacterized protein (TIGR00645 family)
MPRTAASKLEFYIERTLFASRWLLAPLYLGLIIAMVAVLIKFGKKLFVFLAASWNMGEADLILGILSLIDLSLLANLMLIVILSGYENFVSKIDAGQHPDWPEWMGKVDFAGLKLKLLASIVALSAIQLLKAFMDVSKATDRDLIWLVVIHVVFVASGIFLAATDWITGQSKKTYPKASTKKAEG